MPDISQHPTCAIETERQRVPLSLRLTCSLAARSGQLLTLHSHSLSTAQAPGKKLVGRSLGIQFREALFRSGISGVCFIDWFTRAIGSLLARSRLPSPYAYRAAC